MARLIAVAMLLALAGGCAEPDFKTVDGVGYRYADFDGKWRFVNYWATWCGPCIKEIPELNHLAAAHAERVVVLGVNYDEPEGDEALAQAREMKSEFPVYAEDPAAVLGIEQPAVLPTTFVFAPDGSLHATLAGAQTEASLIRFLESTEE